LKNKVVPVGRRGEPAQCLARDAAGTGSGAVRHRVTAGELQHLELLYGSSHPGGEIS